MILGIRRILALTPIMALMLSACEEKKNTSGKDANTGIRYVSFGHGEKTMVVVPGLSTGFVVDIAPAVAVALSTFTDEYTVYLFDVREDVPEDYTIHRMGEDLATAIKDLGLKNIYMYGCSLGGMQCVYVAGKYPELVEKVVVASSACKVNETANTVIGNWIRLAKEGKRQELTEDMGRLIYSHAVYEANKKAFSAMADGLTDELLTRFIHTANAIPNMDISEEAAAIKCPVLILGSAGDKVLTAEASFEIADITGGEIYMYGEEYSHAVYDEAPDFRDRVKSFFDSGK